MTRTPGRVVEHEADEGFAVVDLVGGDEREGFGEGKAEDLDVLIWFGCSGTFAEIAGQIDLHPLAEEAGAGEVFGKQGPTFGAVAGLFDHLAFGGSEGGFVCVDASGGEFDEELTSGVTVLTDKDDFRISGVL